MDKEQIIEAILETLSRQASNAEWQGKLSRHPDDIGYVCAYEALADLAEEIGLDFKRIPY